MRSSCVRYGNAYLLFDLQIWFITCPIILWVSRLKNICRFFKIFSYVWMFVDIYIYIYIYIYNFYISKFLN